MKNEYHKKTLCFTVTTGRTGTTFLTNLLANMPDTKSVHEPKPSFESVMRQAQKNPFIFVKFWEKKLEEIYNHSESIYIETSNVFSKGFLPTLLRMGIKPKLIFLNRSPRKIALSLLSRNSIPGKSSNGLKYSVSPGDPISLPLSGSHWSDYQRCYWAAIDTIFKQDFIEHFYKNQLSGIYKVNTENISDPKSFDLLVNFLYPQDHLLHKMPKSQLHSILKKISIKKHNLNRKSVVETEIFNIDNQELEILNFINFFYPTEDNATLNNKFGG